MEQKIRVLIVDGENNHDWRKTTPLLKQFLDDENRFTVDVSSYQKPMQATVQVANKVSFPPDLSQYDVVVSNYNGRRWPEQFQKDFEARLKEGKLALVIVHAANNSFTDWVEYNEMIGMGWRDKSFGDRLKFNQEGKELRVAKGSDEDSDHRTVGPFSIIIRDEDHPVTKGMPREWMHHHDELYDNMRGPIHHVHVLATAFSRGTQCHEPMIWTVEYGKGRVFHTPMGHDTNAMQCVGFATTLQRGTEWAATGKVTLPLPGDFPTDKKTSLRK